MQYFKADLHIHTVLSPCGDLSMSPEDIVNSASHQGINIIGITDHNTTRHCKLIQSLAAKKGIFTLCGAEVTSAEEAHCLVFMPDMESLDKLQEYLDEHLLKIKNDVDKFGYQIQVDAAEEIIYEEEYLLISATDQSIEEIEAFAHLHNGLFIPAHVNRQTFSLISQLGFIPDDLNYDALEISKHITTTKFLSQNPQLHSKTIITNSDAHFLRDLGAVSTQFFLDRVNFDEVRLALHKTDGRHTKIVE